MRPVLSAGRAKLPVAQGAVPDDQGHNCTAPETGANVRLRSAILMSYQWLHVIRGLAVTARSPAA
jgi:hypothetical protein